MNLIVDIGNTAAKVWLTDPEGREVESFSFKDFGVDSMAEIMARHGSAIQGAILSTTRRRDASICDFLHKSLPFFVEFNHLTPTPLKNLYQTPQTLGMDRLAAAVGAATIAPNQKLLVVDCGTAITIDLVSAKGEYMGGNISPGMSMRFKALNQMTQCLPLCTPTHKEVHDQPLFGSTTLTAIEFGVVQGVVYEIQSYIDSAQCDKIFFTGGDTFYFVERLKSTIFANYELVTIGLNRILEYNAQSTNR